jgi:hypothetical protein
MTRASSFQDGSPLKIRVACYAGYRGEETPRRLTMGKRRMNVVTIHDRWLAPDHRYFKVACDDGGLYIIRHDPHQDTWQLVSYQSNPTQNDLAYFPPHDDPSAVC